MYQVSFASCITSSNTRGPPLTRFLGLQKTLLRETNMLFLSEFSSSNMVFLACRKNHFMENSRLQIVMFLFCLV